MGINRGGIWGGPRKKQAGHIGGFGGVAKFGVAAKEWKVAAQNGSFSRVDEDPG
jgi:hypothetical protein